MLDLIGKSEGIDKGCGYNETLGYGIMLDGKVTKGKGPTVDLVSMTLDQVEALQTRMNFNGNGSLVGKGVTIFLMDGATLSLNGAATVDLSPPTSGPYAGITIYQAPDNTAALTINGASGSNLTGYVYAPAAPISYTGNSSVTSQNCIRIIGDTVTMTGNSYVKTDCRADLGDRLMYVGRSITLVQ